MGEKLVVQNRQARHEYQVLDTFEAGIELAGTEVKSLRAGQMILKDSYVDVRNGEMFLIGAHVAPYDKGNVHNHDPERTRRLLMHKKEIQRLGQQVQEKGLTLVPLKVYFKQGRAKVEIGLCRGKHTFDKRRTVQERDVKREMDRAVKENVKR
jgi:SsrA-binding protein